jgi:hypothetical protein
LTATIDPLEVYSLLLELGTQRAVAGRLGIHEVTLIRRAKSEPELRDAIDQARTLYRMRTYPHGKPTGYAQGCRCGRCIEANRESARQRSQERATRQDQAVHGRASTYQNWGCRCDPCKAAHSIRLKQRRSGR